MLNSNRIFSAIIAACVAGAIAACQLPTPPVAVAQPTATPPAPAPAVPVIAATPSVPPPAPAMTVPVPATAPAVAAPTQPITAPTGKTFYMAPTGKDTDPGTFDKPFLSITRAQQAVSPGDTVFIRGGTYNITTAQISVRNGNATHVFDINKSGTATAPINYFAYPNEKAVFDFATIKPGNRVYAFYVTGNWLHFKGFEITQIQVTETGHTQSECFENHGSNNIYDQLKMHDGMAIGYYALAGANNLVINCDAWNNWDSVSEGGRGGNTDGFGCHVSAGGTGNIFRYCRSWFNSDDGYDCIHCSEPVLFDHCWAMYNGTNAAGRALGDGNGFKAGGYGVPLTRVPNQVPRNTVQFCLSVGNKAAGFYANHEPGGANWFNDTAFGNANNFSMLERAPNDSGDIPGPNALMRNNLGFRGRNEVANLDRNRSDIAFNYFTLPVTVTQDDFESVDEKQLTGPRKADGSLPDITFMHLKPASKLIDAGTPIKFTTGPQKDQIRFPYNGKAPDLGCFETGAVPPTQPAKP